MIAVVIAALLMFVTRLGYWPCIVGSSIGGSLAVATIPALLHGAPRIAFALAGVLGGVFGFWVGTHIIPAVNDEPTRFLSMIEYEMLYSIRRCYFVIFVVGSGLAGMIIGLGMHSMVGRDSVAP